jgi:hypothetical protein
VPDFGPLCDNPFLTNLENLIVECKHALASEFEMKDLGVMHYLLDYKYGKGQMRFSWVKENVQSIYCRDSV